MDKTKFIPSMFHRRLVLLLVVFAVFMAVMTGQMVRLSVVEGSVHRAAAEARLDNRTLLPTTRGRILDRHGRVLAMDRASSDVAVEYDVITEVWPRNKARRQAQRAIGRARWNTLSPEQREAAVQQRLPEWTAKCDLLWKEICRLGAIAPEELHRRLEDIKAQVQSSAWASWDRQRMREQIEFGITEEEFKPEPIREQREPHVILRSVSEEVAFAFRKLDQQLPDMLEVQDSRRREYPWLSADVTLGRGSLPRPIRANESDLVHVAGVADHILGSVRDEVWAQDLQRRPYQNPATGEFDLGGYREDDSVGARGVERVFEDALRGQRGEIRERKGTGQLIRIESLPGRDVQLTLDIALQARVQAILSPQFGLTRVQGWHHNTAMPLGTTLNAAAVVLEVETGEILAMVAMPTIALGAQMSDQEQQAARPLVNRPAEGFYPPGSIIKPLVLSAAVTEKLLDLDSTITCTGQYFENSPSIARCWINRDKYPVRNHGSLKAAEALARSCNIFFFTLGDRLGADRLIAWYRRFGLGAALDVGLLCTETDKDGNIRRMGEGDGSLPSDQQIRDWRARGQLKFNEISLGIGQGPITWTPVQAANAYATIARGGVIRDATLVLDDPRGSRPQRCDDLHLSSRLVATALEGLRQSVMEHFGTGNHISYEGGTEEPIINAQGVQVWAKTGTAQAPPLRLADTNGDGVINGKDEITINNLDHSWFVGLVGPKGATRPMHAIAVIVENGGSGGRTAGPIANQIIRALQAEGYLPGDANAAPVTMTGAPTQPEPEPEHETDH